MSAANLVERFKSAGYRTVMIYIALPDVQTAIDRVAIRVAKGGHDVDFPTIYERFNQGLALFDKTFTLFDTLYVYASHERKNVLVFVLHPSLKQLRRSGELFPDVVKLTPKLRSFLNQISQ